MWKYHITTGRLERDNVVYGFGYSGFDECKNDPTKCDVRDRGPIPTGVYNIVALEDVDGGPHGPYVLRLEAGPTTDTHTRAGFLMHGNNATGTASHGCIILNRKLRELIWTSDCHVLTVVE